MPLKVDEVDQAQPLLLNAQHRACSPGRLEHTGAPILDDSSKSGRIIRFRICLDGNGQLGHREREPPKSSHDQKRDLDASARWKRQPAAISHRNDWLSQAWKIADLTRRLGPTGANSCCIVLCRRSGEINVCVVDADLDRRNSPTIALPASPRKAGPPRRNLQRLWAGVAHRAAVHWQQGSGRDRYGRCDGVDGIAA